jgi:hypothetical protein
MSERAYTPGVGNAPFGNLNTNPQGSQYSQISGYSAQETILIRKAIKEAIFDAAPEQYNALKVLFEKDFEEVLSDEFEYLEFTFGRTALESTAIVAAAPAVAGVPATQVIPMTAASISHITVDLIITYPNGTPAVIRSIAGLNVTVESQTSAGLPAIAVGDIFAIQSTIDADGRDFFANYERLETITRYNFIQQFLRAWRWARIERLKHQNLGTTNYLQKDRDEKMRQIRTDLFVSYFNGTRGEFRLSDGSIAKAMGGIWPTMVAAGSMTANPTVAGLRTAFEQLAFATNYKKVGATRFIYGTDEMLHILAQVFKDPGTRYAPSDEIANLKLKEYQMGTMNFVPVPCELFKEASCFPKDWKRRILVVDQESVAPVKMKGLPEMFIGSTLDRGTMGTRENFQDGYVEANLSMRFNNPIGSFYLDVQ